MEIKNNQSVLAILLLVLAIAALSSASAESIQPYPQTEAAIDGILSLSAQASADVPQDLVQITLFVEEEAKNPAALTTRLQQQTAHALRIAKNQSTVSVQTDNFGMHPSTDREGRITHWRGRSGLRLTSKDFDATARLAGELTPAMQIDSVRFSLSPRAKYAAQEKLAREAIAAFRNQAQTAAHAFDYKSYTVRKITIAHHGLGFEPHMMMKTLAMSQQDIPIAAGKTTVTVTVSGAVQMTR
jgi:predicted secreted protein